MSKPAGYEIVPSSAASRPAPAPTSSWSSLRRRLGLLQWLIPVGLLVLVVAYEMGPARWLHGRYGEVHHFAAEILVYGTVGPVLAYVLLEILKRWLEERETSEVQAQVLAQAQESVRTSRRLTDDALQTLFATSMLLNSLEAYLASLPPQAAEQLREAQPALNQTIQQLRAHLLASPPADQASPR